MPDAVQCFIDRSQHHLLLLDLLVVWELLPNVDCFEDLSHPSASYGIEKPHHDALPAIKLVKELEQPPKRILDQSFITIISELG